jgi:hypothetical protein
MTKNTKPAKPAASADSLVKTTRKSGVELTEQDLDKIAGGVRKAGKGQQ